MSEKNWIPEKLIRIKAHEIKEQEEDTLSRKDKQKARKHLKEHWWEVIFWRIRKDNLDLLLALVVISLFIIFGLLKKPDWSGFGETKVTTNITIEEIDSEGNIIKTTPKSEKIHSGKTLLGLVRVRSCSYFPNYFRLSVSKQRESKD